MKYKLSDICLINKRLYSTKDDYEFVNYLDTGNITKNSISQIQYIDLSSTKLPSRAKRIVQQNDIIYSTVRPNQEHYGFIKETPNNFLVSTGFTVLTPDQEKVEPYWLYCYLTQKRITDQMQLIAEQNVSTYPSIRPENLAEIELDLPNLETQKKIVRILSALDQKIELNSQKNSTYFNICRSLLNNYLSAEDLEEHSLSEFLDVFTGKRNANETSPDGKYIFFSCAPEPLKADTYIFDGSAIIIAGNGAYTGRTRFYEGKMELYQRTYACTPKNNDIQPLIYGFYVYMKNKFEQEKMGGTHGSAIPYIVIGDITKYKILYNKERFEKFSTQVRPFIKAIQENKNESIILANLRNSLLPKLMSGETNMEKVLTNE